MLNPFARRVNKLGDYDSLVMICETIGKSQRPSALIYFPVGPKSIRLWRVGLSWVTMA
jgi:hypothetical protein